MMIDWLKHKDEAGCPICGEEINLYPGPEQSEWVYHRIGEWGLVIIHRECQRLLEASK